MLKDGLRKAAVYLNISYSIYLSLIVLYYILIQF